MPDVISSFELPFVSGKIGQQDFKPTGPNAYLLSLFTREGDLVLDPFAGFGSILLVAKLFKRRFVGFELNKERFVIAQKILETMQVQFGEEEPRFEEQLLPFPKGGE